MKASHSLLLPLLALAAAPFLSSASAQNGVWDSTRTGTNNWTSSTNWINQVPASGAGNSATFGAGASQINVTLNANRTIGSIIVTGVTSSTNRIAIVGTNTLTLSGTDTPVFDIGGNDSAGMDIGENITIAGTQGFEKTGDGILTFIGALHTFTGDILLSGGVIRSYVEDALGSRTIRVTGANTQWRTDAGLHQSDVVIESSGFAITGVGPGAGSGEANSMITGVISETGGSQGISYYNSVGGANRVKRFIVSGDNSYTGHTVIGRSAASHTIVRAASNNAFGVGNSSVTLEAGSSHDANTLELSGGITIANKALTLAGRGHQQKGSLQSLDGENEWQGDVDLGSLEAPTVGVSADSQLTVSGAVTGDATGADGFIKEGEGTLILSGNNSYSGPTTVRNGTLVINGIHSGSGVITVESDATLRGTGSIAGGLHVQGILAAGNSIGTLTAESLVLGANSTFAVELGRTGGVAQSDRIAVSGPVSLEDGTNLSLIVADGADAPLQDDIFWLVTNAENSAVDGVFTHLNGTLTDLTEGSQFVWNSQLWSITYKADFSSLSFSGGNDIALQAIPEPQSLALLGFAAGMLLYRCRKGARNERS